MLVLWLCGCAGRVAVAIQLRSMDAEVVAISRLLAVGALQVRRCAAHAAGTSSISLVLGRASTGSSACIQWWLLLLSLTRAWGCCLLLLLLLLHLHLLLLHLLLLLLHLLWHLLLLPHQLEMEYIFSGLEEEALDVSGDELRNNFKGAAPARHSTARRTRLSDCRNCVQRLCALACRACFV